MNYARVLAVSLSLGTQQKVFNSTIINLRASNDSNVYIVIKVFSK